MHAFRIRIDALSPGTTEEGAAITHVNVGGGANANAFRPNQEVPTSTVIQPTDAQIQGLMAYIAIIRDGTNTASAETAIAALV
jgi:hypothetical protein